MKKCYKNEGVEKKVNFINHDHRDNVQNTATIHYVAHIE